MPKLTQATIAKRERLKEIFLADKKDRKERAPRPRDILAELTGPPTPADEFLNLDQLRPGTPFEVIGLPWVRGTVVSSTMASVRVILMDGWDGGLCGSVEVRTLKDRPKRPERKPPVRKPREIKIEVKTEPKPEVKTESKRVKIFGNTVKAIVCWMSTQGWGFDRALKTLRHFGATVADSTVQSYLVWAKEDPAWFTNATLTEIQIEMLKEVSEC